MELSRVEVWLPESSDGGANDDILLFLGSLGISGDDNCFCGSYKDIRDCDLLRFNIFLNLFVSDLFDFEVFADSAMDDVYERSDELFDVVMHSPFIVESVIPVDSFILSS